ncbi:putative mitochondrial import receptor subunit TOM6 [Helianthus annuus]|nr:putative mitochondrial import receptor subunit TOM6 [Helianthus annuus]
MFPGMFMRKPDKEAALKQLRVHVALFGGGLQLFGSLHMYSITFLAAKTSLFLIFRDFDVIRLCGTSVV